jgi:hypothetical protein
VRKDTGPVVVVRRGVLGGAFFVFALVVMVMLVSWVNRHTGDGPDASLTSSSGTSPARPSEMLDRSVATLAPPTPLATIGAVAPAERPSDGPAGQDGSGAAGTGAPAPALDSAVTLIDFDGIPASLVVRGTVRIELNVQGDTGPIRFVLRGGSALTTMETVSTFQPFLFTPQTDGWDTTSVPNGVYTLTAETVNNSANPLSTQIDVDN